MFALEFEEALFTLQANNPQFEPLFQLPPRLNTR